MKCWWCRKFPNHMGFAFVSSERLLLLNYFLLSLPLHLGVVSGLNGGCVSVVLKKLVLNKKLKSLSSQFGRWYFLTNRPAETDLHPSGWCLSVEKQWINRKSRRGEVVKKIWIFKRNSRIFVGHFRSPYLNTLHVCSMLFTLLPPNLFGWGLRSLSSFGFYH